MSYKEILGDVKYFVKYGISLFEYEISDVINIGMLNIAYSIRQASLTICILEIPKPVLWQTVKTQMICRIMLHFIRALTVC